MAGTRTIEQAMRGRVRTAGAGPLLTYYDLDTGVRIELSATSFANWVDKTANLLRTLEIDPDGVVALPLAIGHPGHWVSLLWPLAAWQAGCGVLASRDPAGADVVVIGPEDPQSLPGATTIACSLHPLGLPFSRLPVGVIDYTLEALAEPDAHVSETLDPRAPAWQDDERELSHADLALLPPSGERRLVRPTSAWRTLAEAVLRPILGGGSAVVVTGTGDLDALIAQELITDPDAAR